MKSSRVRFLGTALVVAVFAVCGLSAAAFDAPRPPVHHVKPQSRLKESHRATAHHAVTHATKSTATHTATTHSTSSRVTKKSTTTSAHVQRVSVTRRHHYYERFTASSFVKGEIGTGDITAGEDPVVRQAAIDALGDMNGTALVIDPSNGRILAMVNQKLALSPAPNPAPRSSSRWPWPGSLKVWSRATRRCSWRASA
jgi:hypothetical protein